MGGIYNFPLRITSPLERITQLDLVWKSADGQYLFHRRLAPLINRYAGVDKMLIRIAAGREDRLVAAPSYIFVAIREGPRKNVVEFNRETWS